MTDDQLHRADRLVERRHDMADFLRHHPEYATARDAFKAYGWPDTAAGELAELSNPQER